MKKLFSIFAAVLFAGSMMAGDSFTLGFTYMDKTDGDGSAKLSTVDAIFNAASQAYVASVETASDVYAGRKYEKDGDYVLSNLKLGTSSKAGQLKFTLKEAVEVDSIVFNAAMYAASEGGDGFSVNGTQFTLSAGKLNFEKCILKPTGSVSSIDIVQTKADKGRFFLTSIEVYLKDDEGGEEETGCAWDSLAWVGDGSPEQIFGSQFKVCVGDPAPNVVNIQKPEFAAESGIYMTFAADPFNSVSLEENQYAVQGAGMVIYLSALTQKENEITVVANEVEYEFTVYNAKGEEAPVEINITSGVVYNEYSGMLWQVIAADDIYTIGLAGFLNEGGTAAGTYELGDLYTEACGMYYGSSELEITAAHITVVVGEDGSITVEGTIVAGGETYSIHFEYTVPTAETTVELTVAEAELDTEYLVDEDDPEFGVMGKDESGVYVQLYIYNDEVEGEYTEEDLDTEYSAIWLTDEDAVSIYSADVKITREGNVYTVKADLLCYNNTLYKVTMTFEVEDDPTGVDNAAVAAKILKAIENGNVVIKTNNTKFNVGGQVIR